MWDLKVCTVCLSTESNLFDVDLNNLRSDYNLVSGLKTRKGNGLPGYLCVECSAYVRRYKSFRDKCQRANFTLKEILLQDNEITPQHIKAINREAIDIMPTLAFSDYRRCKYETTKFKWVKHNRPSVPTLENVTIMQCNTIEDMMLEAPPRKKCKLREKIKYESENDSLKEELDTTIKEGDLANTQTDVQIEEQSNIQSLETDDNYFDDFIEKDEYSDNGETDLNHTGSNLLTDKEDKTADGSTLDQEYATVVPISISEAKAALEVYNMFTGGKFKCKVCNRGYLKQARLEAHAKMHDKHLNGPFLCQLCNFYYKTDFMLKTHMTDKHMYKYICRKCPEVNFDRTSAKQHFIWAHLQQGAKRNANWYESKPAWVRARMATAHSKIAKLRPVRKNEMLPEDFIKITAVKPVDQYQLVLDRRNTRNYITSSYKCNFCYRGFREAETYNKHMKKHDEKLCGPLQCDMCKLYFPTTRFMYKHMIVTHRDRYSCQKCDFVCFNRGQAIQHYRWHKNVVYKCGQCDLVFTKHSTRLTHIRIKHPSTELCNICGHSFVSSHGLHFHKKKVHSREEIAASKAVSVDKQANLYCAECQVQFMSDSAYVTHLGSSSKHCSVNLSIQDNESKRLRRARGIQGTGRKPREPRAPRKRANNELIVNNGQPTAHDCELCGVHIPNDVKARQHYQTEHPGQEFLKRYMCDVCGHTTKQYANLMVHMRTHTREKPYACSFCDRHFSMPSNRDRHMVVHTGEKRYECPHCHRRFTQSSAVKLHIQTVHLKIPYAPWDKKNRKRRREREAALPHSEPKLMVDATGEYINAYITYEQT